MGCDGSPHTGDEITGLACANLPESLTDVEVAAAGFLWRNNCRRGDYVVALSAIVDEWLHSRENNAVVNATRGEGT